MSELTGRELDAAIALQICGWKISDDPRLLGEGWYTKDGKKHTCELPAYAAYSTDLNACREAELAIDGRGLWVRYLIALLKEMETKRDTALLGASAYAKSDATTRCRAMLAALKSAEGQQS